MKKILFTFALLAITLAVSADDAMYASDITIKQGKSATLVIKESTASHFLSKADAKYVLASMLLNKKILSSVSLP